MFYFVPFFIGIVFIIVIGTLIYTIGQNILEWQRNNASPIISVPALIVAKRFDVQHHAQAGSPNQVSHSSASTTYFVTFEMADSERIEFRVRNKEYGLLAERDIGILTYQGSRYLGFERRPYED